MPKGSSNKGGSGVPRASFGPSSEPSEKLLNAPWQKLEGASASVGETARAAEAKIAQNDYETGLIIDQQGFVIAAYRGGQHSVNFGADSDKVRGNTVTHNHPSGMPVFSTADVRSSAILGAHGIRATTLEHGTAYLRSANHRADWAGFAKAYEESMQSLNAKVLFGTDPKEGPRGRHKVFHDWYKANAPKYNLEFSLEFRSDNSRWK